MAFDNPNNSDNRACRLFKVEERLVLLAAPGCQCLVCGAELQAGFHADHVTAFSQGGATDVVNGQVLCPSCNLSKGAKTTMDTGGQSQKAPEAITTPGATITPGTLVIATSMPETTDQSGNTDINQTPPLRTWQKRGVDKWLDLRAQGHRDMTVVACPGAGKTNLALSVARQEILSRRCSLVVVVVPTRQLKRQWARAAHRAGLTLTACWGNGAAGLTADVDGVVVTYSQIARLPEAVRVLCGKYRVFACFDEIHHGGDGLAWGGGLREGFENAGARLCLSGTPFRTDGLNIPFVHYDRQGIVISDVRYPMVQGLTDGVLRPLLFHVYGAHARWRDSSGEHEATFSDRLGQVAQGRRLRTVLDPGGGWLAQVLRHAAAGLQQMRVLHPQAKGFVVCTDATHARSVASLLSEITGSTLTLALGDDPNSAEALEQFRSDASPWLVVCQLGGEGYDLPDLRICVYASTTCTALSFFQTAGRVIRMVAGLRGQFGAVYMPADPRLVALAESYLDESYLDETATTFGREIDEADGSRLPGQAEGVFQILSSEATLPNIIADGEVISQEVLGEAYALKSTRPYLIHLPIYYIAALLTSVQAGEKEFEETGLDFLPNEEALRSAGAVTSSVVNTIEDYQELKTYDEPKTYDERVLHLRRECRRLTAWIAGELGASAMEIEQYYRKHLGFGQLGATLAQLEYKYDVLQRKADELRTAVG